MKIGASTRACSGDLANSVKKLAAIGFNEIELDLGLFFIPYSNTIKKIRSLSRDYDLNYSVHAPRTLFPLPTIYKEMMIKSIIFTKEVGGYLVDVHSGFPLTAIFSSSRSRCIESLKEASRYCGKYDITLSIENLPSRLMGIGKTPDEISYILSELESPNAGFTLDISHANVTKNIDEYIEELGSEIAHVHASDNSGGHRHLRIGYGNINFKLILQRLYDLNYKGCITLELPTIEDVKESKTYLEKMISYLS